MLCKSFSSSSFCPLFRPLEFASHGFRFGNVFRSQSEPQGPRGEVWAFMALVGERHQLIEGGQNICNHTVGGVEVGLANEFPNLVKIEGGLRVEIVTGHLPRLEPGWERRAALFSRKRVITSSPGIGFTLPLFKSS